MTEEAARHSKINIFFEGGHVEIVAGDTKETLQTLMHNGTVVLEWLAKQNLPLRDMPIGTPLAGNGHKPDEPKCPECGGPVYDNRAENEERVKKGSKPRPEFKCKNEDCGWVKWPEKAKA